MNLTILLGDSYEKDPEHIKSELDSLNLVLAEKKAREINEWKEYLEANPEAMEEFEQASEAFARDQGYEERLYDDNYYTEDKVREVYVTTYWQPYPYWFGWPWWYGYACWYPYPWWYHWGYYYGPANVIVFVDLPSPYFMYWHFHHYAHFYYYPHFTDVVVNYYYNNPDINNSISSSVAEWKEESQTELPENWLDNKEDRVERIREYGKFKMDYNSTLREINTEAPSQREYMKSNQQRYPLIEPDIRDNSAPFYIPSYEPLKSKSREIPAPREKVIDQRNSDYLKIDRARNYHQNIWNQPAQRQYDRAVPTRQGSDRRDDQKDNQKKSKHKN